MQKSYRILVLEDSEALAPGMLRALTEKALEKNIPVEIVHVTSVNEAKQALKDPTFTCASFDMVCPRYPNEVSSFQTDGGAQVAHYNERHRNIPYLMYSSNEVDHLEMLLKAHGVTKFPITLKKTSYLGYPSWAEAVLNLIPKE